MCKERQRIKIESRRQGKQCTGKERLKRTGSENTKMKKQIATKKEGRKRRK